MDDITERRFSGAAKDLVEHAAEGLATIACGVSSIPKEYNPDIWAIERGLKEEGLAWAATIGYMVTNGVSALHRNGLTRKEAYEYLRKTLNLFEMIEDSVPDFFNVKGQVPPLEPTPPQDQKSPEVP